MSIQFATPLALALLVALPALLLWEFWRAGARPAIRLASLTSARALPKTWRIRLRLAPAALRIAALALLIVALARPQSGEANVLKVYRRGYGPVAVAFLRQIHSLLDRPGSRSKSCR